MKKYAAVSVVVALFVFASVVNVFANDMVWDDIGRENLNLRTVLIDPDSPRIIYVGSSNAVLKSEDGGENWRNVLSVRGQNKAVNFLLFEPKDKNSVYAATGNGLFFSLNQGKTWNRIFKGKNSLENECTVLAILPSSLYLGTKAGLLVSLDKGRSWHKQSGEIGKASISTIAYNLKEVNSIYVASVDGVFTTMDSGESWKKIFITHPVENGTDIEETREDRDEEERFSEIRYITCAPGNPDCIYLATSKGIYKSCDRGETWEPMTDYGLLEREVKCLLFSNMGNLYAATKSGIFEYKSGRWQEVSSGLTAGEIRFLTVDSQNNLYAACDKGLFKSNPAQPNRFESSHLLTLYSQNEPKIADIHRAAIDYAEVGADKIKEWRRKAKMKAILPKLTVGLDRSESSNYEIYTSATTRYVYDGPNDESHGWDVTLSWDLGDLIWNSDQTSIDVRSRLMVELRDDILDEVTKLYFERIKTKNELDNLSIEDKKKRFEKELKIQEITASLDALTGGYFSKGRL